MTYLAEAVRWWNDQICCHDERGEILEKYCGPYDEVKTAVLDAANPQTLFFHGCPSGSRFPVARSSW